MYAGSDHEFASSQYAYRTESQEYDCMVMRSVSSEAFARVRKSSCNMFLSTY